jgi:hypothetical protein
MIFWHKFIAISWLLFGDILNVFLSDLTIEEELKEKSVTLVFIFLGILVHIKYSMQFWRNF